MIKVSRELLLLKENLIPIKITAMNLPWGGLSDIGPGGCQTCKFWNPPHRSHDSGKEIDIGLSNLNLDMDRIHLLRYVSSIDPNFKDFVADEGGDIAQTMKNAGAHIHIYFSQ